MMVHEVCDGEFEVFVGGSHLYVCVCIYIYMYLLWGVFATARV